MTLTVNQLSQDEVINLAGKLSGEALENFKIAFEEENKNINADQPIALPPADRIYYLIKVQDLNFLLVGINPNYDNIDKDWFTISSFARITTEIKGFAVDCLKKLIEEKLVPMSQEKGKKSIHCNATTEGSKKVFQNLEKSGIKSIERIDFAVITRGETDDYYFKMEVTNAPSQ